MFEGTQRGMPRKRALFGPGCCGSESPVGDVAEAQVGWPAEDNFPEVARNPGVGLVDVVARLQREVEDLHSESLYDWRCVSGTLGRGWGGHLGCGRSGC